jgi:glutamyl-tRNA synthetase
VVSHPSVVTRFAPSPSGELHLGNARTALFSFLLARQSPGGRFLLRIEDTDARRSSDAATEAVLRDLRWLGLDWDGEVLHQSRRRATYDARRDQLARREAVYPCFCTVAELAAERDAQRARGQAPRYGGRCRALSRAEAAGRVARGEPSVLRFRVPAAGTVTFDDLVHGPLQFPSAELGDFVLRRADGSPAFFFSNAVDDAESGVTAVLRGEDHLANTPRQILLLQALDLAAPRYGHLSLLLGGDGQPLSKREGSASLRGLRDAGYLPAAVTNLLFRLGHYSPEPQPLDLDAMARDFDVARLQRAAAHFDPVQLAGWQKTVALALDAAARADWLAAAVPARLVAGLDDARRAALFAAIAGNVVLPADASLWATVALGPPPALLPDAQQAVDAAPAALFATAAAAVQPGVTFRQISSAAGAAAGVRGAALFKPLRAALTGRLDGPDLGALVPVMDPDAVRQRLQRFA